MSALAGSRSVGVATEGTTESAPPQAAAFLSGIHEYRVHPQATFGSRLRPSPRSHSDVITVTRRFIPGLAALLTSITVCSLPLHAAEPELRPEDLPHFPPVEPAQIAGTFEIRPGFHIELAASEPEVVDPVAMSFDAQGRAYVIEMRDYSERRPERLGRVRRLEDRDGDGHYETSTVFLDGLPWPTAITCWEDGVFIGSTPDILYARDTTGDGKADIRETIFTGFASDFAPYATNKLNVQAMMNSLQWGPDCRIHGCGSMSGGKVKRVDSPFVDAWLARIQSPNPLPAPETLDLRGRDFSFDPRRLDLRLESGGGQYGMSFDDQGRKFLCSNSDHLQIARYEERYASRPGWYSPPPTRMSIAADGPAAEVFRISPEEPWRVIRTRWRVTGLVQGLIEGGGRSSGYFTSATGITVYRGDAYGPDFAGDVFIADCGSNLIHRKKIRAQGIDRIGERPPDELRREFLASRDTWFRPVQFANAPDGCLWVLDMYREVIEHPWSLPPNLKRLIDLNAGNDRGRLIRIVPDGKTLRRSVQLASAPEAVLIETLAHPNGWHRDTATRLLHERQSNALPALKALIRKPGSSPLARFHALQLLSARSQIDGADLSIALRDESPMVRAAAIRYAELHYPKGPLPPPFASELANRVSDTPEVRLQLAFSLGALNHPLRTQFLAALLRSAKPAAGESLIASAALSSLGNDASVVFSIAARDAASTPEREDHALPALAEIIGRQNRPADIATAIEQLAALPPSNLALQTALRFADGLRVSGNTVAAVDTQSRLQPLQRIALDSVLRGTGLPQSESIRFLGHVPSDATRAAFLSALQPDRAAEIQRTAIEVLLRLEDSPNIAGRILAAWKGLQPEAQSLFLESTLRRPTGVRRVLDAVANRQIEVRQLSAAQVNALRGHSDPAIQARAIELLGPPSASRHDAVAALLPALSLRGDPVKGVAVHQAQCAPCHRLAGQGHALGPDLESIRSQPKEKLLVAILDPNREVQPTFLSTTLETTDGESLTGLVTADSPNGVTLVQAGGIQHQIPRNRIASSKADGRSIMPEGFEATLTPQQLADLLATLTRTP